LTIAVAALLAAGAGILLFLLALAIHVAPTALLFGTITWLAFLSHEKLLLSLTPFWGSNRTKSRVRPFRVWTRKSPGSLSKRLHPRRSEKSIFFQSAHRGRHELCYLPPCH
jgi:hypothetical protein